MMAAGTRDSDQGVAAFARKKFNALVQPNPFVDDDDLYCERMLMLGAMDVRDDIAAMDKLIEDLRGKVAAQPPAASHGAPPASGTSGVLRITEPRDLLSRAAGARRSALVGVLSWQRPPASGTSACMARRCELSIVNHAAHKPALDLARVQQVIDAALAGAKTSPTARSACCWSTTPSPRSSIASTSARTTPPM